MKRKWWPKVMLGCALAGLYLFFAGAIFSINFFSLMILFLVLLRLFWEDLREHYSKGKNSLLEPEEKIKGLSRREIIEMLFLGFLSTTAFYKGGNWNWIGGLSIFAAIAIWFRPVIPLIRRSESRCREKDNSCVQHVSFGD
jgi:hypothetical protein